MAEKTAGLGHTNTALGTKGGFGDLVGDDATDDEGGGGEGT
jgi:hypothetical protein